MSLLYQNLSWNNFLSHLFSSLPSSDHLFLLQLWAYACLSVVSAPSRNLSICSSLSPLASTYSPLFSLFFFIFIFTFTFFCFSLLFSSLFSPSLLSLLFSPPPHHLDTILSISLSLFISYSLLIFIIPLYSPIPCITYVTSPYLSHVLSLSSLYPNHCGMITIPPFALPSPLLIFYYPSPIHPISYIPYILYIPYISYVTRRYFEDGCLSAMPCWGWLLGPFRHHWKLKMYVYWVFAQILIFWMYICDTI